MINTLEQSLKVLRSSRQELLDLFQVLAQGQVDASNSAMGSMQHSVQGGLGGVQGQGSLSAAASSNMVQGRGSMGGGGLGNMGGSEGEQGQHSQQLMQQQQQRRQQQQQQMMMQEASPCIVVGE